VPTCPVGNGRNDAVRRRAGPGEGGAARVDQRKWHYPDKSGPESVFGSYATSTLVNGSKEIERSRVPAPPAGVGVQPLQLPAVNVSGSRHRLIFCTDEGNLRCAALGSANANVRVVELMAAPVTVFVVLNE